jgi:hypothetical protein
MRNGRVYRCTLAVTTISAIMLIAATTTSLVTIGNAFASNRNQATASANDCGNGQLLTNVGCQNIGSQTQGTGTLALEAQQTFLLAATGFTITGSGNGVSLTCSEGEFPGQRYSVQFSAEGDGTTTSGTYTISVTDTSGTRIIREGVLAVGASDGNTYDLAGRENIGLCNDPDANLPTYVIAGVGGNCGWNAKGTCNTLSNITHPTLVIVGTEDMLTPPSNSLMIAEKIPAAWLVQIRNAGHGLINQYPDKFSKIVATYLQTVN